MRNAFVFSLLMLTVTCEHMIRSTESNSSDEEMDGIALHDPIWWLIRSSSEELWLSQLRIEYPRTNMFGEEVPNFLQFILLGMPDDVALALVDCPERLFRELLEMRERISQRSAIRYLNNVRQNFGSARFHLNQLFGNRRFADERPLEVCDLSRLFSNDYI